MTYDLIIIGSGPAGASAAIYAARKKLLTLLLAPEWGGQSVVSENIENWIGTPSISGAKLAEAFKVHVEKNTGDGMTTAADFAQNISKNADGTFTVTTTKESYTTKSILISTGSTRRKLEVPGAAQFENKGVTYCASCDGPLFAGQNVAVIGGGNAAFESAAQLMAYCSHVTIIQRGSAFRADEVTVEKVLANPNVTAVLDAKLESIEGDAFVSGLTYSNKDGEKIALPVTGIFVEIGLIPTTDFAKDVVERNEIGQIVIDPWTQATSVPGIWAAGDCTNVRYHQNNIASGDGVRALEDLYVHLKTRA